jgi:two-component system, NarL family, sensor histidine kinase DesK
MMENETSKKHHQHGSNLVWLAYSGFFFIDPIMTNHLGLWLKTLAVFATFLIVYYYYITTCNNVVRYWMIAATFFLGVISMPWNGGGCTFFIYAAGFFPFAVASARKTLAFFLLEIATCAAEARFLNVSWSQAIMAISLLLIVGGGNIFFAREKRANDKLRKAYEEIEAITAVAERERIARDLHDVLGHTLSVITLKAELAGRLIHSDPTRAAGEIAEVENTARTALAEVREAIGGYRARGLAAEIESARRALDTAGVTLILDSETNIDSELDAPGPDFRTRVSTASLSAAEETVLALALREAVTNIVRHARAKTCRLHFITDQGHRRLIVEDDGEHSLTREGNGLRGMRERVESIGGHLALTRESGTRLLIELPLRTPTDVASPAAS